MIGAAAGGARRGAFRKDRVGGHRVIVSIDDRRGLVGVVCVAHRSVAYHSVPYYSVAHRSVPYYNVAYHSVTYRS